MTQNINNNSIIKKNQANTIPQPEPQNVPIFWLPKDVLKVVFKHFEEKSLITFSEVCRNFYHVSNEIWLEYLSREFPSANIPQGVNPKQFLSEIYLLHRNAFKGLVTHQTVFKAPDGVKILALAGNGNKAIGVKNASIYIFDLSTHTTTEFIPQVPCDFRLEDIKVLDESKLVLNYGTHNLSYKHVKILDVAKENTLLLVIEADLVKYLNDNKSIGIISRGEANCFEVYDLKLNSEPSMVITCGKKINGIIELSNGKVAIFSGMHTDSLPTLEIWDLVTQKNITPPFELDDRYGGRPLNNGSLCLYTSDKCFIYDPKNNTKEFVENVREHPVILATLKSERINPIKDLSGTLSFAFDDKSTDGASYQISTKQQEKETCITLLHPDVNAYYSKVSHNFSIRVDNTPQKAFFSSPRAMTLLNNGIVRSLNFGNHNELLIEMSNEFSKNYRAQSLLKKIISQMNDCRNFEVWHNNSLVVNKTMSLLNSNSEQNQQIFAELDLKYLEDTALHQHSLHISVIEINAFPSVESSSNSTPNSFHTVINIERFYPKSNLDIFNECAKELGSIGNIKIGLAPRFNLLPKKICNSIYGELEKIIAPKLGYSYYPLGEDAFYGRNNHRATGEECSQAILSHLKKQGYQAEELVLTESKPHLTLLDSFSPLEYSVIMKRFDNKEPVSAINYLGLFAVSTLEDFSKKFQIRPNIIKSLGLNDSQDLALLSLDCSIFSNVDSLKKQLSVLAESSADNNIWDIQKNQREKIIDLKNSLNSLLDLTQKSFQAIKQVNDVVLIDEKIDFSEWKKQISQMEVYGNQLEEMSSSQMKLTSFFMGLEKNQFFHEFIHCIEKLSKMELTRQEVTLHAYLNQWGINKKWKTLNSLQNPVLTLSQLNGQSPLPLGGFFCIGE